MILTDKGTRKEKEKPKPKLGRTLKELEELFPPRIKTRGHDAVIEQGCDCFLELDEDFEAETIQAHWFFENPLNHYELCLYRILCKE